MAGAAAGIGFLAVGGPRKVVRRARYAVFGKPDPLPEAMLPDEIEKALKALGPDGAKVRGALERDFADYVSDRSREAQAIRRSTVLFLLLPTVRILILRFGKQFIEEVLSTRGGFEEQLAKVRARRADASERAAGLEPRAPTARPRRPDAAEPAPARGVRHSPTGEWRNGRRAGLRSRCRVSGVSVRARPRLPRPWRRRVARRRRRRGLGPATHPILAVR